MRFIFTLFFVSLSFSLPCSAQYVFHYQARMGDKVGIFTGDGQEVLPIRYDSIIPLINQTMRVQVGDRWGMANRDNPSLIKPKYQLLDGHDRYTPFSYDSVVIAFDGKKYISFDYAGNKLGKYKVDKMTLFYDVVFVCSILDQ